MSIHDLSNIRYAVGQIHGEVCGSCFLISESGLCLTCAHCIPGGEAAKITVRFPTPAGGHLELNAACCLHLPEDDIACLQLSEESIQALQPGSRDGAPIIPLEKEIIPGSKFQAYGYPSGYEHVIGGTIRGKVEQPERFPGTRLQLICDDRPRVRISGNIRGLDLTGLSGGPVVDINRHTICAVFSGQLNTAGAAFAVPISNIPHFLFSMAKSSKKFPIGIRSLPGITECAKRIVRKFEQGQLYRKYIPLRWISLSGKISNCADDHLLNWIKDINKRGSIIVLGDIGSGKTSLLKHMEYLIMKSVLSNLADCSSLVLYIPLRWRSFPTSEILLSEVSRGYGIDLDEARRLINSERFVFLFDGFDEFVYNLDTSEISNVMINFAQCVSMCDKWVLSVRTQALCDYTSNELMALQLDACEDSSLAYFMKDTKEESVFILQPFNTAQKRNFLKKTIGVKWRSVEEKIAAIFNLEELSHSPILLDVIAHTYDKLDTKKHILTSAMLYTEYLKSWVHREARHLKLNWQAVKLSMELLAAAMYDEKATYIDLPKFKKIVSPIVGSQKEAVEALKAASFLNWEPGDFICFSHKSFLEYFVASAIVRDLIEDKHKYIGKLLTTYEVNTFLVGLLSGENSSSTAVQRVVNRLLSSKTSEVETRNLLYAVGYLRIKDIAPALSDILEKSSIVEARVTAVQAFQRLKLAKNELQKKLLPGLRDENSKVRWKTLIAFWEIGSLDKGVIGKMNEDSSQLVRFFINWASGGHPISKADVISLCEGNDEVREFAAQFIGLKSNEELKELLNPLLKDKNFLVSSTARESLLKINRRKILF